MDIHDDFAADNTQQAPLWERAFGSPKVPHNVDAERALLGALLVSNNAAEYIPDLRPEHFFFPLHGDIFEAINEALLAGRKVTATLLGDRFRNVALGNGLNGAQYLGKLMSDATTIANVREYSRLIIELSLRRTLIIVGEELAMRAHDTAENATPAELVEDAERLLFQVSTRGRNGREISLADAANDALLAAARAHKHGGKLDGIETGFIDLDRKLGGLGNGNFIVIAGRPGMGKTTLAADIAVNVSRGTAWTNEETGEVEDARPSHVHFFSLEMTARELAMRQIGEHSGIPSERLRRGDFNEKEFREVAAAAARMADWPMTIEQMGGLTISSLAAMARREKRKNNTKLIVIDYLQLMQGPGTGRGNRVQEITEITTGLKALAKELNIPVIALSQLSRAVETREDKRPQLSDLRESGSIEQDADVVMFVYREEYYLEQKRPPDTAPNCLEWLEEYNKAHGKAEVIIGKQRHGPAGIVEMAFDGALTRFSSLAKDGGAR